MKVKSGKEIEIRNENKRFIDEIKRLLDIRKEDIVKCIKIYSNSNEIFDSEKYFNEKLKNEDSEKYLNEKLKNEDSE